MDISKLAELKKSLIREHTLATRNLDRKLIMIDKLIDEEFRNVDVGNYLSELENSEKYISFSMKRGR